MLWFRMYAEAVDDDKLRLLAFEDRWHFVAMLCLKSAGILDERNAELRKRRIGIKLGLDSVELETVMKRLVTVGLLTAAWHPRNWGKRQFQSDSSTSRVREFRKRRGNVSETHQIQNRTETDTETEQRKSLKAPAAPTESIEFSDLKSLYPRRAGDQPWTRALSAVSARLREGSSWEEILQGVRRYAAFCRATGKEGTEFVMQAARFCGPTKCYLQPWDLPATKADARLAGNLSAAEEFMRRTEGT